MLDKLVRTISVINVMFVTIIAATVVLLSMIVAHILTIALRGTKRSTLSPLFNTRHRDIDLAKLCFVRLYETSVSVEERR